MSWESMDVPAMWRTLEHFNGKNAWRQVLAWRRMGQLLEDHVRRMTAHRDRVAQAWPPHSSPAAAAFLAHLDELSQTMRDGSVAAFETSAALNGLVESMNTTRQRIYELHERWRERERTPQPAIGGRGVSVAAVGVPGAWKQDLNRQGAATMAQMDTAVAQYTTQMKPPPMSPSDFRTNLPPETRDADGSTGRSGMATNSGSKDGSTATRDAGHVIEPGSVDPLLAGGPTVVTTEFNGVSPGDPGSPSRLGVPPLVTTSAALPLGIGPGTRPAGTGYPRGVSAGNGPLGRGGVDASTRSALPPGGVIRSGGTQHPAARGGAASLGGPGHGGLSTGVPLVGGGRSNHTRNPRDPSREYVEWSVAEGVPPVIEPAPPPQRHDPGPGVFGIDR